MTVLRKARRRVWIFTKDRARNSVINDAQGDDNGEWRRFFINSMIP